MVEKHLNSQNAALIILKVYLKVMNDDILQHFYIISNVILQTPI